VVGSGRLAVLGAADHADVVLDILDDDHLRGGQILADVVRIVRLGADADGGAFVLRIDHTQRQAHLADEHVADPLAGIVRVVERQGLAGAWQAVKAHREGRAVQRLGLLGQFLLHDPAADAARKDGDAGHHADGHGHADDQHGTEKRAAAQPLQSQSEKGQESHDAPPSLGRVSIDHPGVPFTEGTPCRSGACRTPRRGNRPAGSPTGSP